ncbi:hypothetical protein ACP70R_011885 [Stipagrostis hirtigluma subsp. patula]
MEPPPFPHPPGPHPPPPPPPPSLPSALAHLRSLLSAASAALSALPSPLLPHRDTTPLTTTTLVPPPPATTAAPLPPPPASAVPLTIPSAPSPYSDCPAVVRVTPAPIPPSSSLPSFLAAECADFSSASSTTALTPSSPPLARVLPSELCLLLRELDSWGHHLPGSYSHAATRVVAAFRFGVPPRWEAELRRWVLASSPRFGVVIDAAVRDHVWVLLRLCLKAAAPEAQCSVEQAHEGEGNKVSGGDPRAVMFECPRLVEGVSWLGAQLGVLYGEDNGRLFAAAAVKEAVRRMGYCLAVGVGDGAGGGGGGDARASGGVGEKGSDAGDVVAGPVFLSQVIAAIAAMYERFSKEVKIKALQAQRPAKYQLLFEYSQALERGHLERSKRPNYIAILEYDGILSRRVENQESGRAKTREELLAEERDYKRRRASYRGKKAKRNPTEILRDIIDDHMEEIKQAGGIGCLVEAPPDIAHNILKNNHHRGTYEGSFAPASSPSYDKAALCSQSPSCENSTLTDSVGRISSRSHDTRDSYKNSSHGNRWNYYQKKGPEIEVDESYSHQHESSRRQRNSYDNSKYKKDVSESSDCAARSTWSQRSSGIEYDHMLEGSSGRTSQKRHRSLSVTQDQFSDRYDPQSTYSDRDPPTSLAYDVAEGKRKVYHDEAHPREHHERKRHHRQ